MESFKFLVISPLAIRPMDSLPRGAPGVEGTSGRTAIGSEAPSLPFFALSTGESSGPVSTVLDVSFSMANKTFSTAPSSKRESSPVTFEANADSSTELGPRELTS